MLLSTFLGLLANDGATIYVCTYTTSGLAVSIYGEVLFILRGFWDGRLALCDDIEVLNTCAYLYLPAHRRR